MSVMPAIQEAEVEDHNFVSSLGNLIRQNKNEKCRRCSPVIKSMSSVVKALGVNSWHQGEKEEKKSTENI